MQDLDFENEYDVLIIGAGPAGLAAAIWCSDLGLKVTLIEQNTEFGGQLLNIHNPIVNYPGVEVSNGNELKDLFTRQLERSNAFRHVGITARSISMEPLGIEMDGGHRLFSEKIVIATGVRRRKLGIPGESEFIGRGIIDSGAKSQNAVAGNRVAIVGGGDAALENALILSKHADRVFLIHRRKEFTARVEFVDAARQSSNIEFCLSSKVNAVVGENSVSGVEIMGEEGKDSSILSVDHVLIRVGVEPNSELVRNIVDTDEHGYILVNKLGQTNCPSIFAIGDVANPIAPTISGATGDAATASKAIYNSLRSNG